MPIDYKTQVYNQLWALLEAYAPLTALIRVGNRQKLTTDAGWLRKLFISKQSADLPAISIANGRFANSAFAGPLTFAAEDIDFADDGDWVVERTAEFTIKIVSRLNIGDIDPVEEAMQIALLKGGPKLGLPFVKTWGPITATQREDDRQESRNVVRLTTTAIIPVTMIFEGHALVSQNT